MARVTEYSIREVSEQVKRSAKQQSCSPLVKKRKHAQGVNSEADLSKSGVLKELENEPKASKTSDEEGTESKADDLTSDNSAIVSFAEPTVVSSRRRTKQGAPQWSLRKITIHKCLHERLLKFLVCSEHDIEKFAEKMDHCMNSVPIIIVPNTCESLVGIFNIKYLLQDLKFERNVERPYFIDRPSMIIHRPHSDGSSSPYQICDDPWTLTTREWLRVVAAFTYGHPSQFTGWPCKGDPSVIFRKICGFHVKYSGVPVPEGVEKQKVFIIEVNRNDRTKDMATLSKIWKIIDFNMSKNMSKLSF